MLLYVRWFLSSLAAINTDVANVSDIIKDFTTHLKSIHELEMFYGDETLKSLINHSNILVETLDGMDLLLNDNEEREGEEFAEETTT
tara:strand:+ start:552 stop:812 length:261 start_codon:yes stop_codon:yes gene_type:complete